jgi:hypothetical protein
VLIAVNKSETATGEAAEAAAGTTSAPEVKASRVREVGPLLAKREEGEETIRTGCARSGPVCSLAAASRPPAKTRKALRSQRRAKLATTPTLTCKPSRAGSRPRFSERLRCRPLSCCSSANALGFGAGRAGKCQGPHCVGQCMYGAEDFKLKPHATTMSTNG